MTRILFPIILMVALLTNGCTSVTAQPAAATPALPSSANEWTIKMTHSGGIMGLMRSVEVSSEGSYTVKDKRSNKTISGNLSKNEISRFTGIVTATERTAMEKPEGVCADCFIYDIEIQIDGEKFSVQLDDMNLSESGMVELVSSLRELMDSALK